MNKGGKPVTRWRACVFALLLSEGATPVVAQNATYLGPAKCYSASCHEIERAWYNEKDGDKPHKDALRQLNQEEAKKYAAGLGLASPRDAKCVECHAAPIGTRKPAGIGISCETCHGAGSEYLEIHDDKGQRPAAIAKGLVNLFADVGRWAPVCVNCHVIIDTALIKAGHSTWTAQTDLGAKYKTVALHWQKTKYSAGQVTATGTDLARKRAPSGAPTPTAAAPPPAPPPPPPVPTPPPPKPSEPTAPQAAPSGSQSAAFPAAPSPAADQPPGPAVASPGQTRAAPAGPTSVPPARTETSRAPVGQTPAKSPPLVQPPPPPPAPPEPAPPPTAVAIAAERQAALIAALDKLLRRTPAATVGVKPPGRSTSYQGADAELLRLQQEVLALALEALATAPPAPAKAPVPVKK